MCYWGWFLAGLPQGLSRYLESWALGLERLVAVGLDSLSFVPLVLLSPSGVK